MKSLLVLALALACGRPALIPSLRPMPRADSSALVIFVHNALEDTVDVGLNYGMDSLVVATVWPHTDRILPVSSASLGNIVFFIVTIRSRTTGHELHRTTPIQRWPGVVDYVNWNLQPPRPGVVS